MRYTVCAILVAASFARVAAAELSILATAAAQGPVQALDKTLQQPNQAAKVQFDTSPNIAKRLAAGETPDVLIAQAATVDQLIMDIAKRRSVTSIVVTHDIEGALRISNRVALLDHGKLRFVGTPAEFRGSQDPLVRAFADREAAAAAALQIMEEP